MQKYTYYFVFILFLMLSNSHAQQGIVVSGGDISNTSGSISYSVGQVFCEINLGTSFSVLEGIQQPYEISKFLSLDNIETNLTILAYPNPTTDFITLSLGDHKIENLSYQLYDFTGKFVESKSINAADTFISMCDFSKSVYFLEIVESYKNLKSFKIIKN